MKIYDYQIIDSIAVKLYWMERKGIRIELTQLPLQWRTLLDSRRPTPPQPVSIRQYQVFYDRGFRDKNENS